MIFMIHDQIICKNVCKIIFLLLQMLSFHTTNIVGTRTYGQYIFLSTTCVGMFGLLDQIKSEFWTHDRLKKNIKYEKMALKKNYLRESLAPKMTANFFCKSSMYLVADHLSLNHHWLSKKLRSSNPSWHKNASPPHHF